MPLLFKVRLPKKNKAVLFSVFLIGAFTVSVIHNPIPFFKLIMVDRRSSTQQVLLV